MGNKSLAIIAAISVIGLLFLVYLAATFETPQGTTTVPIEQPVPRAPQAVQPPPPPAPVIEEPVEIVEPVIAEAEIAQQPDPVPVAEPLPDLNASDDFAFERLRELEAGPALVPLLTSEQLIRSFVVFADNAAQGNLPQLDFPLRKLNREMEVGTLDDNLFVMEPVSFRRFDLLINTLIAVDVDSAMRLYRMLKPLLQEAYAELGYGDRDFEQTLVQAIDTVLNARTVEGPYQLVKPSVMYLFAEQDIEDMSPVEKQLIRIGPDNAARLKARLAEYKRRLE
ncbi:MAG: DUF3014 domain-containing protein [Pseudomonadales bacterium]|nr:DUF3014 domain-containing protein [Pseudomonadales bacterium]